MDGFSPAWLIAFASGALAGAGLTALWQYRRHNALSETCEQAEKEVREATETLRLITESAFEGVYWVDPDTMRYLGANSAGLKALQVDLEGLRAMPLEYVHPGHIEELREKFQIALKRGEAVRFSMAARRKDGHSMQVELCCAPAPLDGRRVILALGRDLSRWEKSNRKIRKANRLFSVLSQSNRAIGQHTDAEGLLQEICRIAVHEGGFNTAWAALRDGDRLRPLCIEGDGEEWLDSLVITLDDAPTGQGPMARSVLSGCVEFHNDMQTDPLFDPWRQAVKERGFQSMAAVPVSVRGEVRYSLAFYSERINEIDSQMVSLLQDLSADISRGLTRLQTEDERQLAIRQVNQLSKAVEQSADAIMIVRTDGRIDYINPRFTEITGYPAAEAEGRHPGFLCATPDEAKKYDTIFADLLKGRSWKGDFRNRRKTGETYWSHDTISPIRDEAGKVTYFISTSEDYTELRKAQDMIEQLAFYDPLTSLPNRRLLQDRMRQSLELARREGSQVAILFLDLDKFKHINDSLGHPAGDQLLREISERLKRAVRATDTVARLGGDEFTVILSGIHNLSDVTHIADKILEQVRLPVDLEGFAMQVSTSIGITLFPDDGEDISDLLRNADLAMYHSKSLGRNNYQFYTEEINQKALGQVELESLLRKAIESESFLLHYQPQICVKTGQLIGVEALVRWTTHDRGLIPPNEFIPLAEETGLIEPIGEWVMQRALQEIGRMSSLFGRTIKVAINLSAYQFRRADRLKQQVKDLLAQTGINPASVELELTESMLVENVEDTIQTLSDLRALGIKLAIDDFGTGYSSLNYLKQFPIDVLKIDQTFVRDLESNPSDAAITAAIIGMGHQLNLQVVAEGVENMAQLKFLRQCRCDHYQGYYCSAPVPLDVLIGLIREGRLEIAPGDPS